MKLPVLVAAMLTLPGVLGAAAAWSAPAQVSLDKESYTPGERILVTIVVNRGRIAEPRYFLNNDGLSLPPMDSALWQVHPAITGTEQLRLRANPQPDDYSFVLLDGDKMIARVQFEVAGPTDGTIGSTQPTGASPGSSESARGLLALAKPGQVFLGDRFEVVVAMTPEAADAEPLWLRWGDTVNLPWDEKEGLPDSGELAPAVEVAASTEAPQIVAVFAPYMTAGQYELRLFRGTRLLDALVVTVE